VRGCGGAGVRGCGGAGVRGCGWGGVRMGGGAGVRGCGGAGCGVGVRDGVWGAGRGCPPSHQRACWRRVHSLPAGAVRVSSANTTTSSAPSEPAGKMPTTPLACAGEEGAEEGQPGSSAECWHA
jgi:hypothetical protein